MNNTEPWQVWKLDHGECLIYLHPRFVEPLAAAANMPVAEFTARLKKPKRKRNPAKPKAAKPAKAEPAASPRMTFGNTKTTQPPTSSGATRNTPDGSWRNPGSPRSFPSTAHTSMTSSP